MRIGIDLGGTKIAAILMDKSGAIRHEQQRPTPRHDYAATISAIAEMVAICDQQCSTSQDAPATIGIGMPGSLSPQTGLVQNANSTWLNGKSLQQDLEHAMQRPIRLANDANCFALSEARDGAGAGAKSTFGVILGTGCGGGLVYNNQLINGPNAIGGEWGHNPLPWPTPEEYPGPHCWCGRRGCMESWVSGPAIARFFQEITGEQRSAKEIAQRAQAGQKQAQKVMQDHASRVARGLAHVVNIFDPEVIVLGGGLSELSHLYQDLPGLMKPYIFNESCVLTILPPRFGAASGVRGAAWLWDEVV